MLDRSIETHNALAAINADEASPFLNSAVERGKDQTLTAIREVLNGEIAALGIDSNPADILTLRNRLAFFVTMAKELKARLDDEVFVQWLIHNGDLEVGDTRFYAATDKTTKLDKPMRAAIEELMEATGGDMDRFCELLSSSAIKHGACKKVLDENKWREMFRVEESQKVEEGKPKRRVQEINQKFIK